MDKEYSEFYGSDIDSTDGYVYYFVNSPVHTIFALTGSKEAIAAAYALATNEFLKKYIDENSVDEVTQYFLNDFNLGYPFIIDICMNNRIPQLYDSIKAIEGITSLRYVAYDTAYCRLLTDSRGLALAIKKRANLDIDIDDIEVDDEPGMFPDSDELSLPL